MSEACLYPGCDAYVAMEVGGRDGSTYPCCANSEHALAIAVLKGGAEVEKDKDGVITSAVMSVVLRQSLDRITVKIDA